MDTKEISRRSFFRLLAGAAVAPKVSYFLPPIGGWTSDIILHPQSSDDLTDGTVWLMPHNPPEDLLPYTDHLYRIISAAFALNHRMLIPADAYKEMFHDRTSLVNGKACNSSGIS